MIQSWFNLKKVKIVVEKKNYETINSFI